MVDENLSKVSCANLNFKDLNPKSFFDEISCKNYKIAFDPQQVKIISTFNQLINFFTHLEASIVGVDIENTTKSYHGQICTI